MPFDRQLDARPDAAPSAQTTFGLSRRAAGAAKQASLGWATTPARFAEQQNRRRRIGAASHRVGMAAEDAVARKYAREGAAILARRWRCREGELDLVVREPDGLVFVEVKRRKRRMVDDPVGERQWRRLEAAALQYIVKAETGEAPMRFDLAVVGADGTIEVIKNARC